MRNNKGQALIEFILVLPVLLFTIMALIDVASLFFSKYKLEDDLDQVVAFYEEGKMEQMQEYAKSKNIEISLYENSTFATIKLTKTQKMNTPVLKKHLNKIETERNVYSYEKE